jgi:thioredoxin 1
MAENVLKVSDADFKDKISGGTPFIVDFWAEWCGPCRMVAPIYAELASEYSGKIEFGKLNVDENPKSAGDYGVQGIPTFIVFRGGKDVERFVGAVSKEQFKQKLDKVLQQG